MTVSGTPSGTSTFKVQVTDDRSPNVFAYSKNGAQWVSNQVMTGGAQQLGSEGVYVTFASVFGHTIRAEWEIAVASSTATITSSPTTRLASACLRTTTFAHGVASLQRAYHVLRSRLVQHCHGHMLVLHWVQWRGLP